MKIPGFDVIDKLGEDRTSTVWQANQNSLNRLVSIKILKTEIAKDPEEVNSFLQEGRSIAKLKHPNIMSVYDVLNQENTCFFVMEYVPGTTVAKMMAKDGKIPRKRALEIARDVAEALQHAWKEAHVVHSNIKPENIMVGDDGVAKLSFIGMAKTVNPIAPSPAAAPRVMMGTPYYMSPEQAQCSPNLDSRTDMYGLGATLYHMITGQTPFGSFEPMVAAQKQISDFLPHPRDVDPTIPASLANFLSRMLMKERKDRYTSWAEVIVDIRKLISGQMIIFKLSASGVSTIEKEAKPIAVTSSSAPTAAPVKRGLYIPSWLQLSAWAGLLAWWYFLARFMMLHYWAG